MQWPSQSSNVSLGTPLFQKDQKKHSNTFCSSAFWNPIYFHLHELMYKGEIFPAFSPAFSLEESKNLTLPILMSGPRA